MLPNVLVWQRKLWFLSRSVLQKAAVMIIRAEQLSAFQKEGEKQFISQLAAYIREHHSGEIIRSPSWQHRIDDLSDDVLKRLVADGIERGRSYGFTWQSSLASFVVLRFVVAPNFDDDALIRQSLTDEAISVEDRLSAVLQWATDDYWRQVRSKYDPAAWSCDVPF
jgi:hypothetical protein